ncbi:MAG: DUF962 domain-containing protein [Planctomycetota bacterium]
MSAAPRFRSFREFWPYYVGEHRQPLCRLIHYAAAVVGLAVATTAIVMSAWWLLPLAVVCSYGLAWVAHFFVEHNHPATWSYVRWSLMAEYKMFFFAITGRMGSEMERLYGSTAPPRDAPCLAPEHEAHRGS